jgi:hypothetical protein
MVYEKHEYCLNRKRINYEINGKAEIMQHVLKMQQILLFPEYIKLQ